MGCLDPGYHRYRTNVWLRADRCPQTLNFRARQRVFGTARRFAVEQEWPQSDSSVVG